eukprot:133035_1
MLTISTVFLGLIGVTLSYDAKVSFQCDNSFTASVSKDNGATFDVVLTGTNWPTEYDVEISGVTADTILDIECVDVGVVGGFIARVEFAGSTYYTTNPITDGAWAVLSASAGPTTDPG